MVLNYYCQELLRVTGSRFYNYATTIAQGEWKSSLLRHFRAEADGRTCIILSSAKLQLFSETTKHFANYFRSFFTFLLFYLLSVVSDSDLSPGRAEWLPGYVQPAITRQQLVGMFAILEEIDEALELLRIFRADVGGLTK